MPNRIAHIDQAAAYLSALANAKRIRILEILMNGERSVSVLAEMVDLSQSALSQHLSKLRAQELVKTRRDGQTIFYSVNGRSASEVLDILSKLESDDASGG